MDGYSERSVVSPPIYPFCHPQPPRVKRLGQSRRVPVRYLMAVPVWGLRHLAGWLNAVSARRAFASAYLRCGLDLVILDRAARFAEISLWYIRSRSDCCQSNLGQVDQPPIWDTRHIFARHMSNVRQTSLKRTRVTWRGLTFYWRIQAENTEQVSGVGEIPTFVIYRWHSHAENEIVLVYVRRFLA